ncbi:hypothetical protein H310_11929 [Aphanomyces invadans]|uniref:HECT domain-containing protein n=1 Tax=Aphanomyces invadans TaxID=157072 RepID=A0A024TJT0_9STRA|nr:hypothetical protein H310_11929 [Aphanomyces invadans]ETV94254.1 hypothetical protein H310_11929 [Aphanomyces invadans]|eukprot:XP_008877016.1 hypothetical protein H310_11929 [Aphanomyces invadans]
MVSTESLQFFLGIRRESWRFKTNVAFIGQVGIDTGRAETSHVLALGRFLARAINQVLPFSLTVPMMTGAPLSIHDVADETTDVRVDVRDSENVEALDLDLTSTLNDGRSVGLIDGGSERPGASQAECVACLVLYWLLLLPVAQAPLEQVVRGFSDVLRSEVMRRIDYKEVELTLCGTNDIHAAVEWQIETMSTSNSAASLALGWFRDLVERDM